MKEEVEPKYTNIVAWQLFSAINGWVVVYVHYDNTEFPYIWVRPLGVVGDDADVLHSR